MGYAHGWHLSSRRTLSRLGSPDVGRPPGSRGSTAATASAAVICATGRSCAATGAPKFLSAPRSEGVASGSTQFPDISFTISGRSAHSIDLWRPHAPIPCKKRRRKNVPGRPGRRQRLRPGRWRRRSCTLRPPPQTHSPQTHSLKTCDSCAVHQFAKHRVFARATKSRTPRHQCTLQRRLPQ